MKQRILQMQYQRILKENQMLLDEIMHSDECDDTKNYDEEMIPPFMGGLKLN